MALCLSIPPLFHVPSRVLKSRQDVPPKAGVRKLKEAEVGRRVANCQVVKNLLCGRTPCKQRADVRHGKHERAKALCAKTNPAMIQRRRRRKHTEDEHLFANGTKEDSVTHTSSGVCTICSSASKSHIFEFVCLYKVAAMAFDNNPPGCLEFQS